MYWHAKGKGTREKLGWKIFPVIIIENSKIW
jgi:hypothetical protein